MKRVLAVTVLLLFCGASFAQTGARGHYSWEKYGDRIKASQAVSPLGNEAFGDRVSLSNGALSFEATDVAIPGNNALAVAIERQYSVFDRRWRDTSLGMMADWDLNLPNMSAVFGTDWVMNVNNVAPPSTARCSMHGTPPVSTPFKLSDFWHGISLNIPGLEAGEILTANSAVTLSDGRSYSWVTGNGMIRLACLPTIKNASGEGFIAVTPDGTKYWFDWMAQTFEPGRTQAVYVGATAVNNYGLPLKKNTLYATRVEDRFGNNVQYTYSNAWNAPGKLTSIQASDGRTVSLSYVGDYISSISDGTRTWTYAYASTPSGRKTLTEVTQPDASQWLINFSAFTSDGEIKYLDYTPGGEIVRNCLMQNEAPTNVANTFVGAISHPSGAIGTFVMDLREHGRSNVPINCRNVTTWPGQPNGTNNNPNDDINDWPIKSYSFTLKQKSISGPGLPVSQWNYSYVPGVTIYKYPGTTVQYPVCDWANYNCALPPCLSDSCAGSSKTIVTGPGNEWVRYTHGNSYRYNEGKLLKVERGTSATNVLRRETNTYDLSLTNQAYPAYFGQSQASDNDGFTAQYHRPRLSTVIVQDGQAFTNAVTAFDGFARPVTTVRQSGSPPTEPVPVEPPPPPPVPAVPTLTAPPGALRNVPFTVSWTTSADAVSYILERRSGAGGNYGIAYSGPATSAQVTGAVAITLYFRVKACNESSCSNYSAAKSTVITGGGTGP